MPLTLRAVDDVEHKRYVHAMTIEKLDAMAYSEHEQCRKKD